VEALTGGDMSQDLLPLDNPLLNQEAFDKWMDYRKRIKKPYNDKEGQIKRFCQWSWRIQDKAVIYSIENEYQGLFFEKFAESEKREARAEDEGFMARHTNKDWARGL